MVLETKHRKLYSATLKGMVKSESPEGKPLYRVLIKDSTGGVTHTNKKGEFEIIVNVEEDSGILLSVL